MSTMYYTQKHTHPKKITWGICFGVTCTLLGYFNNPNFWIDILLFGRHFKL